MDATTDSNPPACSDCRQRDRRISQLEADDKTHRDKIESLQRHAESQQRKLDSQQRQIDELRKALDLANRTAKRQAAPFSKGPPKAKPGTAGRKPGKKYGRQGSRPIPPQIDETYDVPLPPQCSCGGEVVEEKVDQQYQAEIPRKPIYRQFNVHIGRCNRCGKRVQGRHPLQTSNALGCCASQIGPDAQAAAVMLNKDLGLSQGKISRFFEVFFGMKLTPGGSCRIMLRAADRCEGEYHAIIKRVRGCDSVVPDETGWRIGGRPAWLHVAVGVDAGQTRAVGYLIHRQRGYDAAVILIGAGYEGTLSCDGWAPYGRFEYAAQQTCNAHLLRRCHEMIQTAVGGAVIFPRKVKALLQEGLELRDRHERHEILQTTVARRADDLERRMEKLLLPIRYNPANERLAWHLWDHQNELFFYLHMPGVDATNWRAEQAIRPAVVNRKVWGGNRTEAGAVAQATLMSVLMTARMMGIKGMDFMSQTLRALPTHRPTLAGGSG